MRRFSGRLVAAVVVALCLSVVPARVASAAPWADFGMGGGILAKVELFVARALARFEGERQFPSRGHATLKEGAELDENGSN